MSASFQQVTILGHLGHDPSLNYTRENVPVVKFSVAVGEKRGEKEHTEWFNAVIFDKQAENAKKYLHKGDLVLITGKLETRSYEKEGVTRKVTDLKVQTIRYVKTRPQESPVPPADEYFPEPPDDLPF